MNAIIQQGKFTSDGTAKTLYLRSDVDWLRVWNWTQAATQQVAGRGVEFYWQRGMTNDTGLEYKKTNNTDALNLVTLASGGFTLLDVEGQTVSAAVALTAISTAATPVVSTGDTSLLSNGDVVRLYNVTGAAQLGTLDFTIGSVVTNTSFTLAYMAQLGGAGTNGYYRKVYYDPIFYPRTRYISAITQASSAVITMTVAHAYTAGEVVQIVVPDSYAMVQMNGLRGTVTATSTSTITVDIDSSSFTAFSFPATAVAPITPAMVVPAGQSASSTYVTSVARASYNAGYIGLQLAAGAQSPGGSSSDVMYWVAGKSFNVDNT